MPVIETVEPTSGPQVTWRPGTSETGNYGGQRGLLFVVTPTEPRYADVEQQVRELARLPRGWDGHDGVQPRDEPLHQALTFLVELARKYRGLVRPPLVGPLSDGGVAFVWRYERYEVEILFLGHGTTEFAVTDRDGAGVSDFREGLPVEDLVSAVLPYLIS